MTFLNVVRGDDCGALARDLLDEILALRRGAVKVIPLDGGSEDRRVGGCAIVLGGQPE